MIHQLVSVSDTHAMTSWGHHLELRSTSSPLRTALLRCATATRQSRCARAKMRSCRPSSPWWKGRRRGKMCGSDCPSSLDKRWTRLRTSARNISKSDLLSWVLKTGHMAIIKCSIMFVRSMYGYSCRIMHAKSSRPRRHSTTSFANLASSSSSSLSQPAFRSPSNCSSHHWTCRKS